MLHCSQTSLIWSGGEETESPLALTAERCGGGVYSGKTSVRLVGERGNVSVHGWRVCVHIVPSGPDSRCIIHQEASSVSLSPKSPAAFRDSRPAGLPLRFSTFSSNSPPAYTQPAYQGCVQTHVLLSPVNTPPSSRLKGQRGWTHGEESVPLLTIEVLQQKRFLQLLVVKRQTERNLSLKLSAFVVICVAAHTCQVEREHFLPVLRGGCS